MAKACALLAVVLAAPAHAAPPDFRVTDIGSLNGRDCYANDLNDVGQVVGNSGIAAYLWDATNGMQSLGTLGGSGSYAMAINRTGDIAGYSSAIDGLQHAFKWDSQNGMRDLGTLGGNTAAFVIGDDGTLAGPGRTAPDAGDPPHIVVWDQTLQMQDVGFGYAKAVNGLGQVMVNYTDPTLGTLRLVR